MVTDTNIQQDHKKGPSNYFDRSIISARRSAFLGIVTFLFLSFLFAAIIYQRYINTKQEKRVATLAVADNVRVKMQESLAFSLSATKTLSFFIQNDGSVKNFDSIASLIFGTSNDIDAIQLAPGGIIKYIYPLKGNEKAVGHDVLKDPARKREANIAIKKREMFYAGPFELIQGGMAVVGRFPVFRNDKLWGFSAVVIKMQTLFKNAGIDNSGKTGFYFQLSKINPDTKKEEYFIPEQGEIKGKESVSVNVSNVEWKLSVIPVKVYTGFEDIFLLAILGLLLAFSGGMFVYNESRRPMKLDQLVQVRTRQYKESEEKFSKVFQSTSVGFAILDAEFRFVDSNETYASILGSTKSELLGKTSDEAGLISKINPEKRTGVGDQIEAILNTEGQLHNFEIEIEILQGELVTVLLSIEHLEINNKTHWLTSAIDITANKKAEILIQESEQKYRSLIEQASDGIIITDLKGNFLEVNQSIAKMGGYDIEYMIGKHAKEFVPEEDIEANPFRFAELLDGGSFLHERRYLKKDGTSIDIEINSKLTRSNTLIGFIRDITERKRAEEALKVSEEKYRTLVDQATDGIFIADRSGKFKVINPSGIKMSQYSEEELLNLTIYDLVLPEHIKKDPFHFSEMINNKVARAERRIKRKDGTLLDVEVTAKFISGERFLAFIRDISELKKTKLELEKEYRDNKALINSTSDLLWGVNTDLDLIVGNETFIRYIHERFGLSLKPGDKILRPEHFSEDYIQYWQNIYNKGLAGETLYTEVQGIETLSDNVFEVSIHPIISGDKISGVACFARDITESKKAAKELIEREKFLKETQIIANLGTYSLDIATGRWSGSEILDEIFGIDADFDKSFENGTALVHPDWRKIMHDYFIEEVIGKNGQFDKEYKIVRINDKEERWIHGIGSIKYNNKGEPITMVATIRDITESKKAANELQESEERYRGLLDNLDAGVVIHAPDTSIVTCNPKASELLGLSIDQLKGKLAIDPRWKFLRENNTALPFEEYPVNIIANQKKGFKNLVCGVNRPVTNDLKWLVVNGFPVFNNKNELIEIVISFIDITERKNAEEEIKANTELLRELYIYLQNIREEERTHIAREIHDELGQQLTGLKMDLSWLNRKLKSDDQMVTDKISGTIGLIDTTIKTVRKIATELRPSILDDLGLVAALEWQGEEFGKRYGIKVTFASNLGDVTLQPDIITALFRIYQELLTNVARYANATMVNTSINISDNILQMNVTDNGIGFNENDIISKKTLGLRGIKERTNLIGGKYEIKTRPGEGTFVLISVPLLNNIINP